jgi:(+)-neomenthol dehydrogenase
MMVYQLLPEHCQHIIHVTLICLCGIDNLGTAAVKKLGGPSDSVIFHQLDISKPESVAAFAAWLGSTYGKLDILVNNAGERQSAPACCR